MIGSSGLTEGTAVSVCGWVRTTRSQKGQTFITINDGSCGGNLQLVVPDSVALPAGATAVHTGSSLCVVGHIAVSPRGAREVLVDKVVKHGPSSPGYPLQKKAITAELLRGDELVHLRQRTGRGGGALRVRSCLSLAALECLDGLGFRWVHAPAITTMDCEGAGEMFAVQGGKEFFGRTAYLTVSSQLHAEVAVSGLGRVFTMGPVFRAEHSNTTRHLAEFWMLEPELAFAGRDEALMVAEAVTIACARRVLKECEEDIAFLQGKDALETQVDLARRLREAAEAEPGSFFARMSYDEAVDRLAAARGDDFGLAPARGEPLSTAHERYLARDGRPVAVLDYPQGTKPFYMRLRDGDAEGAPEARALNFDVLFQSVGEVFGGGQREDRVDALAARMARMGLDKSAYSWYLDLARYGATEHAGFGMGIERLVMYFTGLTNVRDVCLLPRAQGQCKI